MGLSITWHLGYRDSRTKIVLWDPAKSLGSSEKGKKKKKELNGALKDEAATSAEARVSSTLTASRTTMKTTATMKTAITITTATTTAAKALRLLL